MIGIEILICLKLIHKIGYLYIDLKENNVEMLVKHLEFLKQIFYIILIDYGFCEEFNKAKNKSPKKYGHSSYVN